MATATTMTPNELKKVIASGVLSFPLTDFDDGGKFNVPAYAARCEWLGVHGAIAMVAAGGAGEFFSLTREEYSAIVRTAVAARSTGPVIASAGYGTHMAIDFVAEAERLGADGILLLPPYLTEGSQEGLFNHISMVCRSTRLGVIIYNRANCRIGMETLQRLADQCPNLIGFKDGIGDIEEVVKITAALEGRIVCINGMPTAEIYAQAYKGMGIETYTSAIFNFVPKSAIAFHRAVVREDRPEAARFVREFLAPYSRIRARQPGYAISIVKAGADIVGRSAGRVRPPLSPLSAHEYEELAVLISALGVPG